MNIDDFLTQKWLTDQILILLIALIIVALLIFLNWKKLRFSWTQMRTRNCLDAIGIKQLRHVACSDGLDGEYIFDRLIMLPKAILLISSKRYSGNIYCAERIAEWTQVVAQKSYTFENPLFELENQVTALRTCLPGVLVRGLLFFDQSALFPKGHPDSVFKPENIPAKYLRKNCAEPDRTILEAWQTLINLSSENASNQQLRFKT